MNEQSIEELKQLREAYASTRGVAAALDELIAIRESSTFFAYSTECGYEEFDTKEKAVDFATEEIDDFRGYACDGWSDEVESVCWGIVMQRATAVGIRKGTDEDSCDKSIEEICDYELH